MAIISSGSDLLPSCELMTTYCQLEHQEYFSENFKVLPYYPSYHSWWIKLCFRHEKHFLNHIEIVCVTCLIILKMGIRTSAMKVLGTTLEICIKIQDFCFMNIHLKMLSPKYWSFSSGLNVLTKLPQDIMWSIIHPDMAPVAHGEG